MPISFVDLLGANMSTFTCVGGPFPRSISVGGEGDAGDLAVLLYSFYNGSPSGLPIDNEGNVWTALGFDFRHSILDNPLGPGDTITQSMACGGGGNSVKALFAAAFSGIGDEPEFAPTGVVPDNDEWLVIASRTQADSGNVPPAEVAGWTTLWRGGGSSGIFPIWWYHAYKIVDNAPGDYVADWGLGGEVNAVKNGTPPPPDVHGGSPAPAIGSATPSHSIIRRGR